MSTHAKKKKKELTTCTITQMIFILLQTYVISQLISSLSPPTDRHMVLCSPMALAKEWICISWDLRSLLPWNEFYTSLIPDLLFTPWPNMQVGLPDAWLDRNDCSGTQQPPSPERRSQTEASSDSEERGMSLFLRQPPHPQPRAHKHARLLQLFTLEMSHSNLEQIFLAKTSAQWNFNERAHFWRILGTRPRKSVSHHPRQPLD